MVKITTTAAQLNLSNVLVHIEHNKSVVLTKYGKPIAHVIPIKMLPKVSGAKFPGGVGKLLKGKTFKLGKKFSSVKVFREIRDRE